MFIKRLITALIAIPITLLVIIYLPPIYFSIVMALLILVGAWEWSALLNIPTYSACVTYVILVALGILFSAWLHTLPVLLIALLVWLWSFIAIVHYQKNGAGAGLHLPRMRAIVGWVLLIATWASIVTLRIQLQFGASWLILMLLIVWAADVGGYFAGRFLGKSHLCARVSPKKTWAGFFGGLILSMVIAAIYVSFLKLPAEKYFLLLVLSFVTALFSVIGDLTVSLFKRMSGLKDSGKFFPGHGGVLDRIDSIMAASVVFVIGAYWIGI